MNDQLNQTVTETNRMSVDIENSNLLAQNPRGSTTKIEQTFENEPTLAQLAELIVKQYGVVKETDKLSMQVGRRSIQEAIVCGEFGNRAKELGKRTGEIPHGYWMKWVEKNIEPKGISGKTLEKWRRLATYSKKYPQEIAACTSLKEAEQACGARSQTKVLAPPNEDLPLSVNGDGEPQPNMAETYLAEIQRSFERIQLKYDQLTEIDSKLNSFLLGKGYDNDLPLLLQQWQSSLSDAFAYFGLEPISNMCVRCGHVRQWDEVFVPISAYYDKQHLQRFNLWCESCEATCDAKEPNVKELADEVNRLKFLDMPEKDRAKHYNLARKLDQLKHFVIKDEKLIKEAEAHEWTPDFDLNNEEEAIAFINNLKPRIEFADTPTKKQQWDIYRHFVSSAPYDRTIGGFQFFLVDDTSGKVLGIGAISNDFFSISERDNFIGWTLEQRREPAGRLCNIMNGSVIVPTALFGSNFLGGKLLAALTTSQPIRDKYKELHGYTLAGLTTTSLFGVPSMYDRIDEWKRLPGLTKGKVPIEPSFEILETWKRFLEETRTHEYNEIRRASLTNLKQRVLAAIYKVAGISDYETGFGRGQYIAELYENMKDFLCSRIPERELQLNPLYAQTVQQITEKWKKKAIKRYQQLRKQEKLRTARRPYTSQLDISDMETDE